MAFDSAAHNGNSSATRKLLEVKADPNLSKSGLDPMLYHAIKLGNLEIVGPLLQGGAQGIVRFQHR